MNRLSEKLRERIDECVNYMSEIDEAVFNKAIQKLAYYEDLEAEGRLVVLPCKVGDTIYTIYGEQYKRKPMQDLIDLVSDLLSLNDDNLAERVIRNNDVQWCLSELYDILKSGCKPG